MPELYDYQWKAVSQMKNGCILCGGVGSGKSRTALAYYYIRNGGELTPDGLIPMDDIDVRDLYIITTARKRDTLEWEGELCRFLMSTNHDVNLGKQKVTVDSWNNIGKYKDVTGAFFIFDEQRVVGSGAWVKSFLKISRGNEWILLSATPGDKWEDYIPVFIANGFYKNRSEFKREHLVYAPYSKFPKVTGYLNTGRLIRLRNKILVNMDFRRPTESHHLDIYCHYDTKRYKEAVRTRWNEEENRPIESAGEFCYILRKIVNSDFSRREALMKIVREKRRVIVFYNFDYELDILRGLPYGCEVAEWNGHRHQPVPESEKYVYLVQYTAGAEGWNCITTDTVIFFSQNYSYKTMEQAAGRIDRLNTPFTDLYFYHLKSRSGIDIAISRALQAKKEFNQTGFYRKGE